MKLRKPCEHNRYDPHRASKSLVLAINLLDNRITRVGDCPGGVFLPDDTLIIEKVDGEWPEWVHERARATERFIIPVLDALSVREAEPEVQRNQLEVPFTNEHGAW